MMGCRPGRPLELDFLARGDRGSDLSVGGTAVADDVWVCVGRGGDEAVVEDGGGLPADGDGGRRYVLVGGVVTFVARECWLDSGERGWRWTYKIPPATIPVTCP
jgi:hypothetical protein